MISGEAHFAESLRSATETKLYSLIIPSIPFVFAVFTLACLVLIAR